MPKFRLFHRHILPGLCAFGAMMSLSGCFDLERFRHEKYSCAPNSLGIDEMIIRQAKKGAKVSLVANGSQIKAPITAISKQTVLIDYDGRMIEADRKSGSLRIHHKNRYYRLSCSVSLFTL